MATHQDISMTQEQQSTYDSYMERKSRSFGTFPIIHQKLYNLTKEQQSVYWIAEEINFAGDKTCFEKLVEGNLTQEQREKHEGYYTQNLIKHILCFFAQIDGMVCENIMYNFQLETSHIKEAGDFFRIQAAIEDVHKNAYGQMIMSLIPVENNERNNMLDAVRCHPPTKKVAEWIMQYLDPVHVSQAGNNDNIQTLKQAYNIPGDEHLVNKLRHLFNLRTKLTARIVAFACVEGILFTSAFASIYWLKKKGIMPALTYSNELIARDEAIHTRFAAELYDVLTSYTVTNNDDDDLSSCNSDQEKHERLSQGDFSFIVKDAVERVAVPWMKEGLNLHLVGLSPDDMEEYIKTTANTLCTLFKYEHIYPGAQNPFPWMINLLLRNKTNFFDGQVSNYAKVTDTDINLETNTEESYF